jgi:hypothetical protein
LIDPRGDGSPAFRAGPALEVPEAAASNNGAGKPDSGFSNNPFADLDSKLSNA